MIVATAGHIDHGKTALIKALTGVDADRLPEEKKRGITVDLGFAYQRDSDGHSFGFVDVPGHEKLVRTMLAGATGVDFVMLVVAADDGIMQQTREHLAILDLLGVSRGVAVVTKTDKVDADRLAAVTADIAELLQNSGLSGADILPVSAHNGDGIADLKAALALAADDPREHKVNGSFRLAIDRAFTLSGAGLVVTGTVHAGRVSIGDRLMLAPLGREVRVRAIHAQNEDAQAGVAGQRCALNITGTRVEKSDISRGDWIVAPALSAPTSRADVRLRILSSETKVLRHWTPVHVHIGSADISGRVSLLEANSLMPGETALGQIVLDQPTSILHGDRFVLRDQSAQRTIGGGRVIDPFPPRRNTRRPEHLAHLLALETTDDADALGALIKVAPHGVDLDHFALIRNLVPSQRDGLVAAHELVTVAVPGKTLLFAEARWTDMRAKMLASLTAYQEANRDSFGATRIEILRSAPAPERPAYGVALDELVADHAVVRFGQLLHLPGHAVKLSLEEENVWFEVERVLLKADIDPPRMLSIAGTIRVEEEDLKPLLEKLGRMGKLRRVSKAYFLLPSVAARLAAAADGCATVHPESILTVGHFREATKISRHATMPVLEFFDRVGLTDRHHDGRRMRARWETIFGDANVSLQGEGEAGLKVRAGSSVASLHPS